MQDRPREFAAYRRAHALFPDDRMVLLRLGQLYEAKGDLNAACVCYERTLADSRVNPQVFQRADALLEAVVRLGAIFLRWGQPQRAETLWCQFLEEHPEQWQLRRRLAEWCIRSGRADEAERHVAAIPESGEAGPIRLALQGCVALLRKNWSGARADLLASYEQGHRDAVQLHGLSVTLLMSGETRLAETVLEELLRIEPRHRQAARNLQLLFRTTGQTDKEAAVTARMERGAGVQA